MFAGATVSFFVLLLFARRLLAHPAPLRRPWGRVAITLLILALLPAGSTFRLQIHCPPLPSWVPQENSATATSTRSTARLRFGAVPSTVGAQPASYAALTGPCVGATPHARRRVIAGKREVLRKVVEGQTKYLPFAGVMAATPPAGGPGVPGFSWVSARGAQAATAGLGLKDSNGGGAGVGGNDGADKGRGGGGDGGQRGKSGSGPNGDSSVAAVVGNNTDAGLTLGGDSFTLETGVDIDRGLVSRSPLVRTIAPAVTFFRSRAGLYGMMLGYVMFTLSQHITPVYVGMSFLTAIGPKTARRLLVLGTQTLSVLTVFSYLQDQFRHQVYPLPAVVSGPSAPYAVITGGSSGIGREIANELAGRGYNILLVARGKDGLRTAAKELAEASREAAEAAQREDDEGRSEKPKNKRKRKRRLFRRRRERKLRSASSWSSSVEDLGASSGNVSAPLLPASPDAHPQDGSHQDEPENVQAEDRDRRDRDAEENTVVPHEPKAITARWFAADLGNETAAAAVYEEVQRLNLTVEILVNAAGVCRVGRVDRCEDEDLSAQLLLNVVGTSRLTRLFAKDFVAKRRGRIMMVSSVVSAAPNPTVAAYAASKSYLTSWAEALHSELEVSGVGVTCVMPGATRTSFQENSGSAAALVWQLPLFSMEADEVAARGVEALMRGDRIIVPGWQNKLFVHLLATLLPRKVLMSFSEAMWR